jgi:hypothetical protein
MINFNRSVIALCTLGFLFSSASAIASTTTYSLTDGLNSPSVFNGNNGNAYTVTTLVLTNAATGLNTLSGFTLNVGDIVNGTVTLNNPLTLPASTQYAEILINLLDGSNNGLQRIDMQESLSFYDKGVQVYPNGLSAGGGVGLAFAIGAGPVATPAFSFDKISFSAAVTGILDNNLQNVSSVNLQDTTPDIEIFAYPTAVPVPAAIWLFGSGLAGLGFFGQRRKAA